MHRRDEIRDQTTTVVGAYNDYIVTTCSNKRKGGVREREKEKEEAKTGGYTGYILYRLDWMIEAHNKFYLFLSSACLVPTVSPPPPHRITPMVIIIIIIMTKLTSGYNVTHIRRQ